LALGALRLQRKSSGEMVSRTVQRHLSHWSIYFLFLKYLFLLLREAIVKLCVVGLPLQKFDPYALPAPHAPAKKSGMSVSLNGTNYVSDATRQDFENALNDGFLVSNGASSVSTSDSISATVSASTGCNEK